MTSTERAIYLVVGATGPIGLGGEICALLRGANKTTRALVRSTADVDRVGRLRDIGVELVPGDLRDSRSLAAACQGVHAVISTASIMVSRQPTDTVENVDSGGQLALVDAEELGGRRFALEYVSEERLAEEEATAPDSRQRSVAGLKRWYAAGDVVDMRGALRFFPMALTTVRDYARRVLKR